MKPIFTSTFTPVPVVTKDRWCWHPWWKIWIYNCYQWIDPNVYHPAPLHSKREPK